MNDRIEFINKLRSVQVPRPVKIRKRGVLAPAGLICLVVLVFTIAAAGGSTLRTVSRYFGKPAIAKVVSTSTWLSKGRHGREYRYFKMTIAYPKPAYDNEKVVPIQVSDYNGRKEGDELNIHFLKSLPGYPSLDGTNDGYYVILALAGLSLFYGVAAWMVLAQRKLLVNGALVEAAVVNVRKGTKNTVDWDAEYQWNGKSYKQTYSGEGHDKDGVLLIINPAVPESAVLVSDDLFWEVDDKIR